MLYNKTLDVKDYDNIKPEEAHINHMKYILSNTLYSFEHKHRMWEYGLVLKALRENKVKTVLDVGGGASIFAPACAFAGAEVIQVDKEDREKWVQQQNAVLPKKIKYIKEDFLNFGFYGKFDAVTAISVLEHVELDEVFFRKLLRFVNPMGIAAITVDFHPDGKPKVKEQKQCPRCGSTRYGRMVTTGDKKYYLAPGFDFFMPKTRQDLIAALKSLISTTDGGFKLSDGLLSGAAARCECGWSF